MSYQAVCLATTNIEGLMVGLDVYALENNILYYLRFLIDDAVDFFSHV